MRVLLAVDGSEQAHQAAESVSCLASVKNLIVVHVIDLPRLAYPMLGPDIAQDLAMTVEQAIREEGGRVLKRAMSHLSYHTAPVSKRLEDGTPAEVILSIAQEDQVDVIIAGARGRVHAKGLALGSVSHRVLTHAPCPVMIIKSPLRELRKILLPVQGPADAERAKQFFAKHPFHGNVEITVFTVVPIPRAIWRPGVSAPEAKIRHALESAEQFNDGVVADLTATHYQVTGLVGMGAPADTIMEQADTMKPDLILMGTHNPSAVSRFLMGSVSHTVLHHATCPVLLVR
ncbi:MAG: universal stress protein [Nitrospirota bacterium]|nr:universal stress protein [Nitrospirota bacterium]